MTLSGFLSAEVRNTHDLCFAAGKTEARDSMPGVKSDTCFCLKGVSSLYPVRPGLDKMIADWKRPRKSPSHFSVEDRIFIQASDRSGREPVSVVLWLTIVQPSGFAHFAPTCAFPVKQPNLFIHEGKSDRS